MTVLLSHIPGFHANPPRKPTEPDEDMTVKLLGRHVGEDAVRRMLESGTLVLMRGYENFPAGIRASAAISWPRPACVFDKGTGRIFADTACLNALALEMDFLVCAGTLALGNLPIVRKILEKAAEMIGQDPSALKPKEQAIVQRAILRYGLNSRVWKPELRGAAFLAEIANDMTELFTKRSFESARKIIQTGKGRFTLSNFAGLLYILTKFASEQDAKSLAASGVELYDSDELASRELPLDAVCTLRRDATPTGEDFFGRSLSARQALELATGGYMFPNEPLQLLMEDWSPSYPVHLSPETGPANPLSSLSIRPFAQFSLQCLTPPGKAPTAQLLAVAAIDPLEGECTDLAALPAVQCARKTAVRITGADVSENLAFATLSIIAPDLEAGPIPAIATTWPMQADRLKTNRLYEADLAFWASGAVKSAERSCWLEEESDYSPVRPRVRMRGEVLSVEREETLAGMELVRLEVSLAPEEGRKIDAVLAKAVFEGSGAARGDFVELTGFFLAGNFTSLEKKRELKAEPARKDLLSMAPVRLRRLIKKFGVNPLSARYLLMCQDVFLESGFFEDYQSLIDLAMRAGSRPLGQYASICGLLATAKHQRSDETFFRTAQLAAHMMSGTRSEAFAEFLTDSDDMSRLFGFDIQSALRAAVPMKRENLGCYQVDALTEMVFLKFRDPDHTLVELLFTNVMLHAVNAGLWKLGLELAKRYALGIGAEKSEERAARILSFISDKGDRMTSFAPRAFQRLGEKLFTLEPDEVLAECKAGIAEGNYGSILLTGLWYAAYAKGDDDLRTAYGLLKSVEKRLGDKTIMRIGESIRLELGAKTPAKRRALDAFDPWRAIGVEKPDLVCSLYRTLHVDEAVREMHSDLYSALDPEYAGQMTERIMRQFEFVSQGEAPAFESMCEKAGITDTALRLTEVQGSSEEGLGGRLLMAYLPTEEGWLMREAYPFFERGVRVPVRLMSGIASTDAVSVVLLASYVIPSTGESVLLSIFDALWPLYATYYNLGDEREFTIYGIGRELERLPEGTLRDINLTTRGEIRRLGGSKMEQALHTIVSPVLGIRRRVAEIAGVAYAELDVMPFFEMKPETMPVYLPDALVPGDLKIGDEVKIGMQLNGYTLAEPLESEPGGNA